jgi:hypothetical protein
MSAGFEPEKRIGLAEATGLALPLEEGEDVAVADRALDVADDGAVRVVEELDADLGDVTGVTGATEDALDLDKLDGLLPVVRGGV